jgi:peptidoglycan hydrolase-like protein with peptidoglycan-binding domain
MKAVVRFLFPLAVVTSVTFSAAGIAAASPAQDPHACPIQAQGMAGPCVTLLQNALHVNPADGKFGPATAKAVRAYQQSHHLLVDGKAGPQVFNSLFPAPQRKGGPKPI